ncbi:hypothetical protein HHX47_DHR1002035 [Lentinula edodes]|nr:hypothetical protein HHX47_DHR1002035 [Lentinula edodes]
MLRFKLLALCALATSPLASAVSTQSYSWNNVKIGGGGGFIPGIVFNPNEKGLAYARADIGGAYRLNSDDSWTPLLDFADNSRWNYWGVDALATDPIDTSNLYLATGMYTNSWDPNNGQILISKDKGDTWTVSELPFKVGGNMPGRGLGERLAIDPNDNSILFFGARSGHGLWKSTNSAVTWTQVTSFPSVGTDITPVSGSDLYFGFGGLSVDLQKPGTLMVAALNSPDGQIFRSTDSGATWSPLWEWISYPTLAKYYTYSDALAPWLGFEHTSLTTPPAQEFQNPEWATAIDIDYAGNTPTDIVRIGNNAGSTLQQVAVSTGGKVAYSANADTVLWSSSTNGVLVSQYTDGLSHNSGSSSVLIIPDTAFTAVSSLPSGSIIASDKRNNAIFFAASGANFYMSTDTGHTFAVKSTLSSSTSPAKIVMHPNVTGDVWVSTDKSGGYPSLYAAANIGGTIGYFRTDDQGTNWVQINDAAHGFGSISSNPITADLRVYGRVFIGTNGRGIFYGVPAGAAPPPTSTVASTSTTSISSTSKTTTTPTTISSTTSSHSTTTSTTSSSSPTSTSTASAYGQCGGSGWTGPTACVAGYTCVAQNTCKSHHFYRYTGTDRRYERSLFAMHPIVIADIELGVE